MDFGDLEVQRRRTGRTAARPGGASRRRRPPRPGAAVGRGARGVDDRRVVRLGGGVAGTLRHRRSRHRCARLPARRSGLCVAVPRRSVVDRLPPSVPGVTAGSVPGYELRALIGTGELGEVHRAYQPAVGREVAVRIFGPWMVGHPQFVRRFESGSQRIARVDHPHVLPLLDYWREPSRAVMVSRLVRGGHLRQRIPADGMDPVTALALIEKVAAGISVAHRLGVVHGRVRPENILFDDDDNPYVADLGIDEICTGIVSFATHAYDAPERLGGALATPASDIYSLGLLVHEVLGGSPPPADGALPPRGDAVDAVIARATDPDPRRRHGSVDELVDELREALAVPLPPLGAVRADAQPVPGPGAVRGGRRPRLPRSRRGWSRRWSTCCERERLMVVFGPSGIGKSSVVKAGLVPALRRGAVDGSESWLVTEMTPGSDPFEQLRTALARVATADSARRRGRVESLRPLARRDRSWRRAARHERRRRHRPVRGAVHPHDRRGSPPGVRADARGHGRRNPMPSCGSSSRCGPTSSTDRSATPGSPTPSRGARSPSARCRRPRWPRRSAGPPPAWASRSSRRSSTGSPPTPSTHRARCRSSSTRWPSSSPSGRRTSITLAAYEESGGLAGAIGRRAEAIYVELDDRTRSAAREVFLRLVSVDEEHEDTRRRVRRTELEHSGVGADELDVVLREYGRHRLLTFDRDAATRTPTVEVAHEALLSEWPRLKELDRRGARRPADPPADRVGRRTTGSPPGPMPASCSPAAGSSWPNRGQPSRASSSPRTSSGS